MAYLITCAGAKNKPTNDPSSFENLSYQELHLSRLKLVDLLNIELDWSKTLPAWKLYSGKGSRLYPKVLPKNWNKEYVEIKILSALFGWIKHTDKIPYYDLQMSNKIPNSTIKINQHWLSKGKLKEFISHEDVDLLSTSYRKAINPAGTPVGIEPNIIWNDKYGVHKGIWLNQQLEKITCIKKID